MSGMLRISLSEEIFHQRVRADEVCAGNGVWEVCPLQATAVQSARVFTALLPPPFRHTNPHDTQTQLCVTPPLPKDAEGPVGGLQLQRRQNLSVLHAPATQSSSCKHPLSRHTVWWPPHHHNDNNNTPLAHLSSRAQSRV